ncbi:unnamed protein product, partial [Didymodactylos carnosus]
FSNLTIKMFHFYRNETTPVLLRYGLFTQQILHFLLVGFYLYLIVTCINKVRMWKEKVIYQRLHNEEQQPVVEETIEQIQTPVEDENTQVFKEIRDLLLLIKVKIDA